MTKLIKKTEDEGIEKVLFLFDTHIPFNIDLNPIFEFTMDFKPHRIILGGDMHDFPAVSTWVSDQSRHLDGGTIEKNFEQLKNKLLVPLTQVVPDAQLIYLEGNHEFWLHLASQSNPNGRGYWELANNIDGKIDIVPINTPYKVSQHLYTLHGPYTNEYHAKKVATTYHKTVLYGHVHTVQTHTIVSPIDSKILYKGHSVGCLCKRNPAYMRNRPNAWVLGFNYAWVEKTTGFFWDNQVYIIDGRFRANGRTYK